MGKLESAYQEALAKKLRKMYKGSIVKVNDGRQIQGFPDIEILYEDGRWAVLECKRSDDEPFQPNQEYYIDDLGKKGFARVIFPENEEEVLDELQRSFKPRRTARSLQRK